MLHTSCVDDDSVNSQRVCVRCPIVFVAPFDNVCASEVSPDSIEYPGSRTIFEMLVLYHCTKAKSTLGKKAVILVYELYQKY